MIIQCPNISDWIRQKRENQSLYHIKAELVFKGSDDCDELIIGVVGTEHPSTTAVVMVSSIDVIYDSCIVTYNGAPSQRLNMCSTQS
jgi:hypothetical protein